MSRDFKIFMNGLMIVTILFMIGYIRLQHQHVVEMTYEQNTLIKNLHEEHK